MTLPEGIPSSPSRTGQQQTNPSSPASIQVKQVNKEQPLPTRNSQTILAPPSPVEAPTLADIVTKAVHIISEMSMRQEVPTEVHSRILGTFRFGPNGTPATTAMTERPGYMWIISSPTAWLASMWINMLEASHTRSQKATILNMIEWIGASEWYDAKLEQAEKAPPTKRGTLRKRLAIIVLNKYLKEVCNIMAIEYKCDADGLALLSIPASINSCLYRVDLENNS